MSYNYYEKFLEIHSVHGNSFVDDPQMYKWYLSNMPLIIRDAQNYREPKQYKYMVTFTVDPSKVPNLNDLIVQESIEKYITKIVCDRRHFTRVYYVKEHAQSNVHWHVVLYSKTAFKQDMVKYYKKKYGNVDISRSYEMDDEYTRNYLSKDSTCQIVDLI